MAARDRPAPWISAAFATERGARDAMEFVATTLGYSVRGHLRHASDAWGAPALCVLTLIVPAKDRRRVAQLLPLLHGVILPDDTQRPSDGDATV